jgi:hypothetical protein
MAIEPEFVGRINLPDKRVRAYMHVSGTAHHRGPFDNMGTAKYHLEETLGRYAPQMREFDFVLAALWGREGNRMMDFIGLSDIGSCWTRNADVGDWTTENGIVQPRQDLIAPNTIACEDTWLKIFTPEMAYRKSTPDIETYSTVPPKHLAPTNRTWDI